ERDQQIEQLAADLQRSGESESGVIETPPNPEMPRHSQRQVSSCSSSSSSSSSCSSLLAEELSRVQAELELCRSELLEKTQELRHYQGMLTLPAPSGTLTTAVERKLEEGQKSLRQLRLDLQCLGRDLQSAERACCHSTNGERLRLTLANADSTLAKQNQALGELQNGLLLVKMDLRKKTDRLAKLQTPPMPSAPPNSSSCVKRGCGGAGPYAETHPPSSFLRSFLPGRPPSRKAPAPCTTKSPGTPYSRVLRTRQRSPPPSPTPHHKSRGGVF
ncbi:hypothetical protein JZ751_007008, partial [Albula glossodonta]